MSKVDLMPIFEKQFNKHIPDALRIDISVILHYYPNMSVSLLVALIDSLGTRILKDLKPRAEEIKKLENRLCELRGKYY